MTLIIYWTTLNLCFIMLFLNHPLSFGIALLAQTMLIALMTGTISLNFWFSYILFLVMVGGMLILFIYMTSVASNEKFKFSMKLASMTLIIMSLIPIIYTSPYSPMILNPEEMNTKFLKMNFSMSKYTNLPNCFLMLLIFIYLLIALIMVVKITNVKYGPLRQKF